MKALRQGSRKGRVPVLPEKQLLISFDGLRIDPQLPRHWKRARLQRSWRGAEFEIVMRQLASVRHPELRLDGRPIKGNLNPCQPAGTRHTLTINLPGKSSPTPSRSRP
jgi:hypothetical protein